MTHTTVRSTRDPARRRLAAVLAALAAATTLVALAAAPAHAAARLSASSSLGGAAASSSGPTTFTVSGSGFQAIDGGFGGVYVGFGWINGSGWGPSAGGATGRTYDYVPDEQSRNNKGYQAFVAFPGSDTSGEAQGTMSRDGSFRLQLTVPGPTFTGAGGKKIDCLEVTCGFFTWGAHGVRNGTNETFTPVTFQAGAASGARAQPEVADAPTAEARVGRGAGADRAATRTRAGAAASVARAPAAAGAEISDGAAPADSGGEATGDAAPVDIAGGTTSTAAAVIEVDRQAARAGGAMGFAAAGFWPGEQVYVVLGEGAAAVGPVAAGVDGEVAGVIVLPEHIEPGTHEIRAAGAGSGLEASERFPVRDAIVPAASSGGLSGSVGWIFLALATLALLAAGAVFVRRRQENDAQPATALEKKDLP